MATTKTAQVALVRLLAAKVAIGGYANAENLTFANS